MKPVRDRTNTIPVKFFVHSLWSSSNSSTYFIIN